MDTFERELRTLLPGSANRGLRALIRARRRDPHAIRNLRYSAALTASGASKLETLAVLAQAQGTPEISEHDLHNAARYRELQTRNLPGDAGEAAAIRLQLELRHGRCVGGRMALPDALLRVLGFSRG